MKKKFICILVFIFSITILVSCESDNKVSDIKSNANSYKFEDFMDNKVNKSEFVTVKGALLNPTENNSTLYLIDEASNTDELEMYIIKYIGTDNPNFDLLTTEETIRIWGTFAGIDNDANLPTISVADYEIEIDNTKDKNLVQNIRNKAVLANCEQITEGDIGLLTPVYIKGNISSIIDTNEIIINENISTSDKNNCKIYYFGDKEGDFKTNTSIKFWGVVTEITNEDGILMPVIIAIDYE